MPIETWYRVVRFGTRPKPVQVTDASNKVVRVDGSLEERNSPNVRYMKNEREAWLQLQEWAVQNENRAMRNVDKARNQMLKVMRNLEGQNG